MLTFAQNSAIFSYGALIGQESEQEHLPKLALVSPNSVAAILWDELSLALQQSPYKLRGEGRGCVVCVPLFPTTFSYFFFVS